MLVLARISAALVAAVIYLMLLTFVWIGFLFIATWRGYSIPGYHEPGPWWGWLLLVAWVIGLLAVVWWAGFRAPWWHHRGPQAADPLAASTDPKHAPN